MKELKFGICTCARQYQGKFEGQKIEVEEWLWELRETHSYYPGISKKNGKVEVIIREVPIEADLPDRRINEELRAKGCRFFLDAHQESSGEFEVTLACVPLRRKHIKRGEDYIDWFRKRPPSPSEVLKGMTKLITGAWG